nr:DNA topoisomerase [Kistimonas asteriae]
MKSWFRASEARARADWSYQFAVRALTYYARGGAMGPNLGQGGGRESVVSVGRVQTPTLALVVERCREIRHFVPTDHFLINGHFSVSDPSIEARYHPPVTTEIIDAAPAGVTWEPSRRIAKEGDPEPLDTPLFTGEQEMQAFRQRLLQAGDQATVIQNKERNSQRNPPLPCDLAEFQAEMHKACGMTAAAAQKVLEKLYNDGLVTYPRTEHAELPDSLYAPNERNPVLEHLTQIAEFVQQAQMARDIHDGSHQHYPARKPACFTSKPMEHYGIIPTRKSANLSSMNREAQMAYCIVARRYIQALWPAASLREQKLAFQVPVTDLLGHPASRFTTSRTEVVDPGWMQAFPRRKDEQAEVSYQAIVPAQQGMLAPLRQVDMVTRTTRPSAYYTDRTLIKAMKTVGRFVKDPKLRRILRESAGIGTPATRSTILETLLARKFIVRKGSRLESTASGESLVDGLPAWMTSAETTAVWEDYLTRVCELRNDDNLACEKRDRFVYRQIDRLESWLQELQGSLSDKVSAQGRHRFTGGGAPTPKMAAYARSISRQVGIPLPDNALTDRQACSTFIDTYQAQASQNRMPTPKMLGLARKLAQERQLGLPDEIVSSFDACRAFIDGQLGSSQSQTKGNTRQKGTRKRQSTRRQGG